MKFPAKPFDEIKTAFTASFIGSFVGEESGGSTNWVIQGSRQLEQSRCSYQSLMDSAVRCIIHVQQVSSSGKTSDFFLTI